MNISAGEGTPVLGGIRRKETINALERRRNTVFAGERQNHMQTLGTKNEFNRNRQRSTLDSRTRRAPQFTNGIANVGYDDDITSDDDSSHGGGISMNMYKSELNGRAGNDSLSRQSRM